MIKYAFTISDEIVLLVSELSHCIHMYSPLLNVGTPDPVAVFIVPTPHFLETEKPFLVASVDGLAFELHGPANPLFDFLN